jgi:hypothetical protein
MHCTMTLHRPLRLTGFFLLSALLVQGAAAVTPTQDAARWLAGLDAPADPHLAEVQKEANAAWESLQSTRIEAMARFAQSHFGAEREQCDTLFYPFGGPDILNALSFFPACRRYILFGLEHVGEMPDLDAMSEDGKARLLRDMLKAQRYIVRRNFFVTSYMSGDLNTPNLKGVLPMLCATLVRMGYTVTGIELANLDGSTPFTGKRPKLARVHFRRGAEGPAQELDFASFDASDDGLGRDADFLAFMEPVRPTVTLIKAASYLLHDRAFARMRGLVEDKSTLLVQDDTGLPYALMLRDGFKVELYGNYVSTIPAFRYRYQNDLAAAYKEHGSHLPLPFAWSYAWRRDEAGLQVARRTPAEMAAGDLSKR